MRRLLSLAVSVTAVAAHLLNFPLSDLPPVNESLETRHPSSASLPSEFKWTSSAALVGPKPDGRNIAGIKDPSIIFHGGKYHVFASTAQAAGYSLVYFSFTDFAAAGAAQFHYLDQSPIGKGYRAAPQVFWYSPQQRWYLVYQTGNAAYSTNANLSNPGGWSAPRTFYSGTPATVARNIGKGYWVDMWVICDAALCHLFSSDDNGHLYRSQTTRAAFPAGMGEPVIALQDSRNDLFEAANVYRTGAAQYLLLVEAIGARGARYFRSWTATDIAGPWSKLAATQARPFAGAANVGFAGPAWTESVSHGEMIRTEVDERMAIGTGTAMRYLYQGVAPGAKAEYNALPWRLGLLTQVQVR
jgi:Glycosyl hydrolase family 62